MFADFLCLSWILIALAHTLIAEIALAHTLIALAHTSIAFYHLNSTEKLRQLLSWLCVKVHKVDAVREQSLRKDREEI